MAKDEKRSKKSIYREIREELGYSREAASELLETIPPERIERIETGKLPPHPDEILRMADVYKKPELSNYYCSRECPIGERYIPEIKMKDLSQIVLEMVASLNAMHRMQERLIDITEDGRIEQDEIEDFIAIQEKLEKISITVETLQLWTERMIANNKIDRNAYLAQKENGK